MRAGDAVFHAPSGETWLLAYGDTDSGSEYVSACGWPESLAKASDCTLKRAATDEEHAETIRNWSERERYSDYGGLDRRHVVAKRILAARASP